MKYVFVSLLFLASASFAQPLRLHLMGGFANYTGDIQQKRFTLNQAKGVVSAGATYNFTDKLAIRADYSFAKVGADDKYNTSPSLKQRNLNFQTIIQEFSLVGEYDILSTYEHALTPYVFGGLGVFHFSPYTTDPQGNKIYLQGLSTEGQGFARGRKVYKKTQLNIPIGGGLKFALSDDIQIGFEIGLRVLKTDYLDDVSTTYIDQNTLLANRGPLAVQYAFRGDELKDNPTNYPPEGVQRGNGKVNDFYYFGQFRISFRMPWMDSNREQTSYRNSRKRLGCPSWK